MAKRNPEMRIAQATALVDAAMSNEKVNHALVNTLRNHIKKEVLFMGKQDGVNKLNTQLCRLPNFHLASEKYAYIPWATFQLWIARTLANKGMEVNLSKHVLETFYRVAGKKEQKEMTELLSK